MKRIKTIAVISFEKEFIKFERINRKQGTIYVWINSEHEVYGYIFDDKIILNGNVPGLRQISHVVDHRIRKNQSLWSKFIKFIKSI